MTQTKKTRKPRGARAALQAENERLTKALNQVGELASISVTTDIAAWSALGGIKYLVSTTLRPAVAA